MSLNRIPLFVWAQLVTVVHDHLRHAGGHARQHHADRSTGCVGTHFFNPAEGGDALLVAAPVLVLRPPRGLHHLPARRPGSSRRSSRPSRRRPIFGYLGAGAVADRDRRSSASASGSTTCSRPGCRSSAQAFFTASSLMIAIPNGVQIFCWIATLWGGRPRLQDAAAVRPRLLRHLRDRRADRRDAGLGVDRHCRSTTRTSSSPTSTTC